MLANESQLFGTDPESYFLDMMEMMEKQRSRRDRKSTKQPVDQEKGPYANERPERGVICCRRTHVSKIFWCTKKKVAITLSLQTHPEWMTKPPMTS